MVGSDWLIVFVDIFFLKELLERNPAARLGRCGIVDVVQDPWFAGFDWHALMSGRMPAPFTPSELLNAASTLSIGEFDEAQEKVGD